MGPLVILGTGLAGYTLAREFRKLDAERPLVLLTQDDGRSYSKPMLSNALAKAKTANDLGMASADDMAAQLKATVRRIYSSPAAHGAQLVAKVREWGGNEQDAWAVLQAAKSSVYAHTLTRVSLVGCGGRGRRGRF